MDTDRIKVQYEALQVLESEGDRLADQERLAAMRGPLLAWYGKRARALPWRDEPEPYRVWISEIMLQQTRVEAVKPYFDRFMKELPNVGSLAKVPEERLLKLWEGLGYYNRARNLQKAAIQVIEEYGGDMPYSEEELIRLPGIGSYTAGAIASIAFGRPVPAVDGNVLRVLSRVLASRDDILKQSVKKKFEDMLRPVIPKDNASSFNQALIEVGALVCVPNGQPKCKECPMNSLCLAAKEGLISEIPVKTPKKQRRIEEMTVCIIEYQDTVALRKRSAKGLLASLYEFPNVSGYQMEAELAESLGLKMTAVKAVEKLPRAKHIFSHVEWHMEGYRIVLAEPIPDMYLSVPMECFEQYAVPNAFAAYRDLLKGKQEVSG